MLTTALMSVVKRALTGTRVRTHTGGSLEKLLTELYNWGEKHAAGFGVTLTDSFAGRIAALKRETS